VQAEMRRANIVTNKRRVMLLFIFLLQMIEKIRT
jgi:hypothetical protein